MATEEISDADLVAQSLAGDRDAFGRIVSRYQSLVCSLAYSATGDISRSEDLAQETFLAAWRQLPQLRDPGKLRPWLCRVARNLACNATSADGREPTHLAGQLENLSECLSPEMLPVDRAISNEEQAILWRSLETLPAIYREPLVLFYREHHSVEAVARSLDLSEDAVKQRLSRGRKMLQEQVLAFVENALARTSPGKVFTLAVLSMLPAAGFSAKAASLGAAVKAGTATQSVAAAGWLGILLSPLTVLLPNYVAYRVSLAGAHSDDERAGIKSVFRNVGLISAAVFLPTATLLYWISRHQEGRFHLPGLLACLLVTIFVPTMFLVSLAAHKRTRAHYVRLLEGYPPGVLPAAGYDYRSRLTFLGLPLLHIRLDDQFATFRKPVKAWVAIGHSAMGGLFACGAGAIAPVSVGGLAIGLLSFGGISCGVIALGGIALGIWPVFGALAIGWQTFGAGFAFGWNAAVGELAFARDYALGQVAVAANANNEAARQVILPHPTFQLSRLISRHWIGLTAFWAVPFLVMWRVYATRARRCAPGGRASNGISILLLAASLVVSAGCNKSGELGKSSTLSPPAGPVRLQQHWRAGERIEKSFELKMASSISVPNQPRPILQNTELHQLWAIRVLKENADGSHEGEMELIRLRMKLDQDGKPLVDFDSDRKPSKEGNASLEAALEGVSGAKLRFNLSASNRIEKLDGAEELRNRVAVTGAGGPAAGMRSLFNDASLWQLIGDSHYLPSRPVQAGDTWRVEDEASLNEMGNIASEREFTLQQWERRGQRLCARLEFQGTLKGKAAAKPDSKPDELKMSLQDGTFSGVSWFDPEIGLEIESNAHQDIRMLMTLPVVVRGRSLPMTLTNAMRQAIHVKLESVKQARSQD